MELLTHGSEHHEIGDGGRLMMMTTSISTLRSPERTLDQPSRWRTGGDGGSVSWIAIILSPWFFSGKIGFYSISFRVCGATRWGQPIWARQEGGALHPRGQGVDPLTLILSPIFFINYKPCLRKFSGHSENFYFCTKITPSQFCWKQHQFGLVPFK